jgi:DNA-binding MarR family transcriptional regulator
LKSNPDVVAEQLRPVLTRLVRKLRRFSPADGLLSQTERSVMVLLEQQGAMLAAELAVVERITPQSMGQVINKLDGLGFIEKQKSPDDKRKIFISLSEKGKEMIARVRNERTEWLGRAIAATCTPQEQEALLQALVPLAKLIEFE